MTFDINLEDLRKELVKVYSYYLSDDENLREQSYKMAIDIDGLWSGDFLFRPEITTAIRSLRYIYIEPKISKEEAKKILEDLENVKS